MFGGSFNLKSGFAHLRRGCSTMSGGFLFADGLCGGGIFGPGVAVVAGAEFFADFGIGVGPETGEILGDLDGAVVGGEEVEGEGNAAIGDGGGGGEAEDFLDADGEDWGLVGLVVDVDLAAGGDGEVGGDLLVEGLDLGVSEVVFEGVGEIDAAEGVEIAFSPAELE